MKSQQPTEHEIQAAFFDYTKIRANQDEIWAAWFAVPNGGFRHPTTATRLRKEGVKPGVPDTFWPIMRGRFGGLWIEFKRPKMKPSENQAAWIARLREYGYRVEICDSIESAINISEEYAAS